jgi:hypothetical protein
LGDVENKIKDMAKLVVGSNRISEMHKKNLEMWPLIMFNGVQSVTIDYDLSYKHDVDVDNKNNVTLKAPIRNSFVSYHLTMDENAENPSIDKRFKALEDAVRSIFWKDLSIEVHINNKIVYKSSKKL